MLLISKLCIKASFCFICFANSPWLESKQRLLFIFIRIQGSELSTQECYLIFLLYTQLSRLIYFSYVLKAIRKHSIWGIKSLIITLGSPCIRVFGRSHSEAPATVVAAG